MREHMGLFRGKRVDNGKWVEGSLIVFPHSGRMMIFNHSDLTFYEVDPNTVGECTGLEDKNGKLIFEGDICDNHVQGDILVSRGVIKWDAKNGRWTFQLKTMNPDFYLHNPDAWEIIGNIHDNPELLEGAGDNADD